MFLLWIALGFMLGVYCATICYYGMGLLDELFDKKKLTGEEK
jgi:hypothetical protein